MHIVGFTPWWLLQGGLGVPKCRCWCSVSTTNICNHAGVPARPRSCVNVVEARTSFVSSRSTPWMPLPPLHDHSDTGAEFCLHGHFAVDFHCAVSLFASSVMWELLIRVILYQCFRMPGCGAGWGCPATTGVEMGKPHSSVGFTTSSALSVQGTSGCQAGWLGDYSRAWQRGC